MTILDRFALIALLLLIAAMIGRAAYLHADQMAHVAENPLMSCVDPAYDRIGIDLKPAQLVYGLPVNPRSLTDDKERFAAFRDHVQSRLAGTVGVDEVDERPRALFTVAFHWDRGAYRQLAAAVICKRPFPSADNECRNRTYFFFAPHQPEDLARLLLDDIVSTVPKMRLCGQSSRPKEPPQ